MQIIKIFSNQCLLLDILFFFLSFTKCLYLYYISYLHLCAAYKLLFFTYNKSCLNLESEGRQG